MEILGKNCNPILLAGPDLVTSRKELLDDAGEAHNRGITILRMNGAVAWPEGRYADRAKGEMTRKEYGKTFIEVAQRGMAPATEVIDAKMAKSLAEHLVKQVKHPRAVFWIGAKTQQPSVQREIAHIVKANPGIMLMLENPQTSGEEFYWNTMIDRLLSSKIGANRLIGCYQGFRESENSFDLDMAMRVKRRQGIPMVIDPSTSGGYGSAIVRNFERTVWYQSSEGHVFDGLTVDVSKYPAPRSRDTQHRFPWEQLDRLTERHALVYSGRELWK